MKPVLGAAGAVLVPAAAIVARAPAERVGPVFVIGLLAVVLGAAAAGMRRSALLGAAALALGTEYAISLGSRGRGIDPLAPVVALLIFLAVELTASEIETAAVRTTRRVLAHHFGVLARVGLAAWIACVVVIGGAAIGHSVGTTARLLGAGSAWVAVALLAVLSRRSRRHLGGDAT